MGWNNWNPKAISLQGLRAVLFDLDGTLAECHIDFKAMREEVLSLLPRYGLPREGWEGWLILEILHSASQHLPAEQAACLRAEAEECLLRHEMEAAHKSRWLPGVAETLRQLRERGLRLGLLTRNHRAAVELMLQREPLPLDAYLARNDVPHPKPHRQHPLQLLSLLHAAPEEAWLVGDHPTDMLCAQSAGILPVGVLTGVGTESSLRAAGAVYILPSVASLQEVLEHG